jgi:hypothetical protein
MSILIFSRSSKVLNSPYIIHIIFAFGFMHVLMLLSVLVSVCVFRSAFVLKNA